MTAVVLPVRQGKDLSKKVAGGVLVLFWVIALALWIVAPNMTDPRWGAFLIDTGIVFFSVGFAAPQITSAKAFGNTLIAGVVAVAAFAVGDFLEITVLSYMLRMLVPFLALLSALYATVGKIKVWYN
ncbi:MAG: hypothetical protein EPO52_03905 [Herbiconiux sp.]|uniref:hypothetical protein n=1 Tax=Herbiconiux sp. TaxID=1871186 RepID=UPI00121B2A0F|nr:hypothetical protein [Herbiconiux sp.]TAJ49426.1 MAG: hypothetical protein EPO52_03905 [Herbiconiux sp.]